MKINIKTLKGTDFFDVNLEETATVAELKDKIATEKQKEKDTIKLVHKGKQLTEESKTLGELGIKDNDFVILMFFQKKAEKEEAPQQAQSATTTNTTSATTAATTTASTTASNVPKPAVQQPATTQATGSQGQGNELLQGEELEAKIQEIESMGFERAKILQALKAAYYNPERAVDYLLSGNIPQVREGGQQQQGAGLQGPGLEQLAQLAQNPQFQHIAQAIRQNPALLQPVMQQLAQTNPEVARILQQNPQAFLQLLLAASENEGGQTLPPNAIQVTPEEKADIDDIISMGFDKNDALEAYITCDKNKELAINYLFDAKESGALLSEHIQKEELEAAQQQSQNQNQQQQGNNPNQQQQGGQGQGGQGQGGDEDDDDDDDEFMYQ
ncbi:hypothetical protein ABPG74_010088 [Tetrahymena malaccensis]